jgi:pyrroline-5-carboxylate reductase
MTFDLKGPLVLGGAGKMGAALRRGLFARGLDPGLVLVQDPAPAPDVAALLKERGVRVEREVAAIDVPPAVLLLAVKPQIMDTVLPPLGRLAGPDTLVVSIAAGRTIASLARHLTPDTAIVRAMPNTPASVGRAITVCVASAGVSADQRRLCDALLSAVGDVAWIDDEGLMDAVTAVSGSGPAYVFLLAEALAEAGKAAGLDEALAKQLARATVAGAGELLRQSEVDARLLREAVTSPGGTTAAALSVLMGPGGLEDLMKRAVAAAAGRSRELAK